MRNRSVHPNPNSIYKTDEVSPMTELNCQQRLHQFLDASRYYLLSMPMNLAVGEASTGDQACVSPDCR
jgi:hypothetical protein